MPEPAIEGFTTTQLRLDYRFQPPSLLPRFMVQSHGDITTELAWRSGAVLENRHYDAKLLICADKQNNRIELFAKGISATMLFPTAAPKPIQHNHKYDKKSKLYGRFKSLSRRNEAFFGGFLFPLVIF